MAKTGFEKPDMAVDDRGYREPKVGKKWEIWLRIIKLSGAKSRQKRRDMAADNFCGE